MVAEKRNGQHFSSVVSKNILEAKGKKDSSKYILPTDNREKNMTLESKIQIVKKSEISVMASTDSWGLDRSDQRDMPLDSSFVPFTSNGGSGVKAFILDTGIYLNHNDFENRAIFGINTSGESFDGDGNGHGTHVAGTVGGKRWGIAKMATLVAVKVLQSSRNCGITILILQW